jgi:hypothetical protein
MPLIIIAWFAAMHFGCEVAASQIDRRRSR